MRIKIRTLSNSADTSIIRLRENLKNLPNEYYTEFRKNTPKDTGNARDKTRLQANTVVADYEYATSLDKGSSKKAPKGMTKPTEDYIEKLIQEMLRK